MIESPTYIPDSTAPGAAAANAQRPRGVTAWQRRLLPFMIGAVGVAALVHPERLKFLRSPAPWVAIVALFVALIPHLLWLKQVDFAPLSYAGDTYELSNRAQNIQLVLGYIGHNLALLALNRRRGRR